MEIGVGNRSIPPDHDIASEAQLELAKEDRIREIAVVANLDFSLFTDREMDAVHRATAAEHEGFRLAAQKTLEGVICRDTSLRADAHIRRQRTMGPSFRLTRWVSHVSLAVCEPPN